MMQISLFSEPGWEIGNVEDWCVQTGYRWVVGVDEAGRGPLAGPVQAAAVLLDLHQLDDEWLKSLNDSKKLSESAREDAFDAVIENACAFELVSKDAGLIDQINILQASLEALADCASAISARHEVDFLAVDGNQRVEWTGKQRALVKGDGRSLAIAAASILAKVTRDRFMKECHETWPEYRFDSNKGYGSKVHLQAIETYGPCEIHRLSFAGVREHSHRLRELSCEK